MRDRSIVLALASLAVLAAFSACQLQTADFSAYTGKNLIPEAQLDLWTPDQTLTGSPGSLYMNFERVDTSGTSGFSDSASLYSGLPASANTSTGGQPPVYRLEIRNLFRDGDLEASPVGAATVAGGAQAAGYIPNNPGRFYYMPSSDPTNRLWGIIDSSSAAYLGLNTGKVLNVQQGFNDTLRIDLSSNLTAWDSVGGSYNLGFRVYVKSPPEFYLCMASATNEGSYFHINTSIPGAYSFPTGMTIGASSTFNTFNGFRYLHINPINAFQAQISVVNIDDFQVVRTDQTYAIRYEVPLTTGAGLNLVQGGTYTLSVWIRQDPTAAWGNAARSLNRFPASKISLAVSDSVGTASQYWSTGRIGPISTTAASAWTKVSASFTGMFNNSTTYAYAAPTQKMLQLCITALDTTNDSSQFPGSILVTSPSLVFTP